MVSSWCGGEGEQTQKEGKLQMASGSFLEAG